MNSDERVNRDAAAKPQDLDGAEELNKDRPLNPAPDMNPDPITGEPGAHPVGTGLGTAGGGAAGGAVTGAVVGSMAGPVGTAIGIAAGAIVGGVAGGYAGKAIAESVNPTAEEEYWEAHYRERPYVEKDRDWDYYRPAYEHGYTGRSRYADRTWEQAEPDLKREWEDRNPRERNMDWDRARPPARDAWNHIKTRRVDK